MSNTAVPTVSAIVSAGATPVFVDIKAGTYLMDIGKVEKAINNTKCILPVHLYGQCVAMEPLDIAKKHHLNVLEDCAQAHGSLYKSRKAGSMGDLSVFFSYPTKPLGGYGDGGMVITSDEALCSQTSPITFLMAWRICIMLKNTGITHVSTKSTRKSCCESSNGLMPITTDDANWQNGTKKSLTRRR